MSTLKVTNLQHPSAASANVTLDSSGNAAFSGGITGVTSVNGGQLGARNAIINGGMVLSQRYGTASQSPAPNGYGIDRWRTDKSGTGTWSIQQSTDAPSGFSNSALLTVTSSSTPSGSNYYQFQQRVEGYNIVSFGWGASGAKDVTLSFWVKSSVTGTYGGSLRSAALDYSYVFNYTINSANTWEYKTVNISGPTVSTWNSTNGIGIYLMWSLGEGGSNATSTVGSWVSGSYHSSTGATNLIATNSATWQITGVMLETGDTATSYPHEDVGTTLQKAQRYYWRQERVTSGVNAYVGTASGWDSTAIFTTVRHPTTMRASPSLSYSASSALTGATNLDTRAGSAITGANLGVDTILIYINVSGATEGKAYSMLLNSDGNWIACDAEL